MLRIGLNHRGLAIAALLVGGCTADVSEGLTFGPGPATSGMPTDDDADPGTDTERAETEDETAISASDSQDSTTGMSGPSTLEGTGDPDTGTTEIDPYTSGRAESSSSGAPGECTPNTMQSCYSGPNNTENIGECASGNQVCDLGGNWGACEDEILPADELCNNLDDDCNGIADDGDPEGGGTCTSDLPGPCAPGVFVCAGGDLECEPNIEPAASDICDNNIDDDCNGTPDDGCTPCNPLNPAAECGAGNHCEPAADGNPVCLGPVGTGTQYDFCAGTNQCADIYACIDTGVNDYCLQWCDDDFDCPNFLDVCVPLTPSVFVGGTEWGVCYDGLG